MPRYVFVCDNGHVTEKLCSWPHPRTARCGTCRSLASYDVTATFRGSLAAIPDIPEHMNQSLGEVVRSRRHLRELQQKHDTRDYHPIRDRDAIKHEAWKAEKRRESEALG